MANGIFVGLSTVDVVYSVDNFPSGNSKIVANSQDVFVGGPATNASIAFAHLGGRASLVSVVGRNAITSVIRADLQQYAVQLIDLNPAFDQPPPISSVSVNPAGDRNVVSANATRVSALPAHVDEAVLGQASIVLVDGHYMQACHAWASAAHARGIPVVLDGGSWKPGIDELLKNVDTAICSADFKPPACATQDEVLTHLKDLGVRNVAVTNGADPVRFVSNTSSGAVSIAQVDLADTMGAGDIFHGAFCYYFSTGQGFVGSLAEAASVATESCRFHGTREWMKHLALQLSS